VRIVGAKMTDRLRDLKRGNAGSGGGQIGGGTQGGDITMSQIHQPAAGQGLIIPSAQRQSCLFSPDAFMKTFFEDVEMVKSHLTQISQATDNLREIHSEVFFLFPLHSPWLTSSSSFHTSLKSHSSSLSPSLLVFSCNDIRKRRQFNRSDYSSVN
jgi:hypothetical protein